MKDNDRINFEYGIKQFCLTEKLTIIRIEKRLDFNSYGNYLVHYSRGTKIRILDSVIVGSPGTYIMLNNKQYEINDNTFKHISIVLHNREVKNILKNI